MLKGTSSFVRAATLGVLVVGSSAATAAAAPAPFTFNPALASPALSSSGSSFTADNIIVSQFSSIDVASGGAFTESGILSVAAFQSSGAPVFPAGFASIPGATPYGLYFTFTGAGTSTGTGPGATGNFSALTVNFFGDVGNNNGAIGVTPGGATFANGTGGDVLLATGTLVSGTVALGANSAVGQPNGGNSPVLPSAFALVQFSHAPGAGGFFVDPATFQFDLNAAFTNSGSVTTFATTAGGINLTIRGGGGNGTISSVAVPEPVSIALLGTGLIGLGFARRGRKQS